MFAPINAGEQAYSLQNAPTKIGYQGSPDDEAEPSWVVDAKGDAT